VLQELALGGVEVANDRLETFAEIPSHAGAFDGFTSRATLRLAPSLALAARVVAPGGRAFLWKGSRAAEEMEQDDRWREAWELVGAARVGTWPSEVRSFKRI
jgi:16S rRNA (guanine527-N7)-methyltransferase